MADGNARLWRSIVSIRAREGASAGSRASNALIAATGAASRISTPWPSFR
jgi:hypothetical protein